MANDADDAAGWTELDLLDALPYEPTVEIQERPDIRVSGDAHDVKGRKWAEIRDCEFDLVCLVPMENAKALAAVLNNDRLWKPSK